MFKKGKKQSTHFALLKRETGAICSCPLSRERQEQKSKRAKEQIPNPELVLFSLVVPGWVWFGLLGSVGSGLVWGLLRRPCLGFLWSGLVRLELVGFVVLIW